MGWVTRSGAFALHTASVWSEEVVRQSDALEQDELLDLAEIVRGNDRVGIKQSLNYDLL